jgi:hypothetical protein
MREAQWAQATASSSLNSIDSRKVLMMLRKTICRPLRHVHFDVLVADV